MELAIVLRYLAALNLLAASHTWARTIQRDLAMSGVEVAEYIEPITSGKGLTANEAVWYLKAKELGA
jgi:hypothetical protein